MRKLFYIAVALLVLFEIANVWLIMPMPFSQRMQSIDVAYRLHTLRWVVRVALGLLIVASLRSAWQPSRWRRVAVGSSLAIVAAITYATNFVMAADQMFIAPKSLSMQPAARNVVEQNRLVVGIEVNGEARAYPVQYIGYHHQVRDTVAGKPVMVSFCTVCRTGRVFDPVVNGSEEQFRLVGMDHFNAMFEDATTKSWWRQANGEAVAGPLAGRTLAEIPSRQVTLAQWLALHPNSLIMQPDSVLAPKYSKGFDFETGASRKKLTGTDTVSWSEKAWVVGITAGGASKAYDWNRLKKEGVINDQVGTVPIVLALASDKASFFAFQRPDATTRFALRGDSLVAGARGFALTGIGADGRLQPINASQEFWHSWRTFQPATLRY